MFCKHKFIKDNNNIYCEKCGKYKRMKCDHKFKMINEQKVSVERISEHLERTYMCEICGLIKHINLTTGKINEG